jgi:hypothetical protein
MRFGQIWARLSRPVRNDKPEFPHSGINYGSPAPRMGDPPDFSHNFAMGLSPSRLNPNATKARTSKSRIFPLFSRIPPSNPKKLHSVTPYTSSPLATRPLGWTDSGIRCTRNNASR